MSVLAQVVAMLGGPGLPVPLPAEPFAILHDWFDEALREKGASSPEAMALATVDSAGQPSARMVLCKEIRDGPGAVVFYTNLTSRKARELLGNPRAAVVFHFASFGRQARIEGLVERLGDEECDEYFATRHTLAKLGAWASEQSQPIGSRTELAQRIIDAMAEIGINPLAVLAGGVGGPQPKIPRPPNWGGYLLVARRVELWTSSHGRLHDRAQWRRGNASSLWEAGRLQP